MKLYIMVQTGLPEYEGRTHYQVRSDRPWTKEELWGFQQVTHDTDEISGLHSRIDNLREALEYIAANEDYYGLTGDAKRALLKDKAATRT
jgi:hypothetical protein